MFIPDISLPISSYHACNMYFQAEWNTGSLPILVLIPIIDRTNLTSYQTEYVYARHCSPNFILPCM